MLFHFNHGLQLWENNMKKSLILISVLAAAVLIFAACGDSDLDPVDDPNVVAAGDIISVEYTGRLSNGEVFDSSEGRAPLEFVAGGGQMIPGFDEAVLGMRLDEEKTVEIPAAEAYGETGAQDPMTGEYIIPPNEDITFDIKVVSIRKANADGTE